MIATTQIRARIPTTRLKKVRGILSGMGMDTANLINMVFAQVERDRRLPVEITGAAPEGDGYEYARQEYGLTREEADAFAASAKAEIAEEYKNGTLRKIT